MNYKNIAEAGNNFPVKTLLINKARAFIIDLTGVITIKNIYTITI